LCTCFRPTIQRLLSGSGLQCLQEIAAHLRLTSSPQLTPSRGLLGRTQPLFRVRRGKTS
jgi:hypothetical protein